MNNKPQRGEIFVAQSETLGYNRNLIMVLAYVFGTKTMTKPIRKRI